MKNQDLSVEAMKLNVIKKGSDDKIYLVTPVLNTSNQVDESAYQTFEAQQNLGQPMDYAQEKTVPD